MTTSYDVEQQSSDGSVMPGHNSEGFQTWNPSVGLHFKAAAKNVKATVELLELYKIYNQIVEQQLSHIQKTLLALLLLFKI